MGVPSVSGGTRARVLSGAETDPMDCAAARKRGFPVLCGAFGRGLSGCDGHHGLRRDAHVRRVVCASEGNACRHEDDAHEGGAQKHAPAL